MVVHLEGSIRRYIGLSTDEKPALGPQYDISLEGDTTGPNDMPTGSSFMETDTGHIYRWDGERWTLPAESNEQLYVLQALLLEMTKMREMVELALNG